MGDFPPEIVSSIDLSLKRIATALETMPVPDIDDKLGTLIDLLSAKAGR